MKRKRRRITYVQYGYLLGMTCYKKTLRAAFNRLAFNLARIRREETGQ